MEIFAIPAISDVDIYSLVLQTIDPDAPDLSVKQKNQQTVRLSTLVKNKLNGVDDPEFSDEENLIADMLCANICDHINYAYITGVHVCLTTGETLIEGITYGSKV